MIKNIATSKMDRNNPFMNCTLTDTCLQPALLNITLAQINLLNIRTNKKWWISPMDLKINL